MAPNTEDRVSVSEHPETEPSADLRGHRGCSHVMGMVATIEKLIASAGQAAPRIREDLARLEELRGRL